MRWNGRPLVACVLALLALAPPAALAQSTFSDATGSTTTASRSTSLASSDVLGALALGAGGRNARVDVDAIAPLLDDPMLGDGLCLAPVRVERDGSLTPTRVRLDDQARLALAKVILDTAGAPTDDDLAAAFEGRRTRVALAECPAVSAREILLGGCTASGRGCAVALVIRLALDADGLTDAERQAAVAALRRR